MKTENISRTISSINQKYVNEASSYTAEEKAFSRTVRIKRSALAACCALVAVLGLGIFGNGLLGAGKQFATLDNGDIISFLKSGNGIDKVDANLAFEIKTRELTEAELDAIFPEMQVYAHAVINAENSSVIGIEGNADGIKLIISAPGIQLNDVVLVGQESTSKVNGVYVNAGYFTNNKNAVYYASFMLGENTVYVEHSGAKEESETLRNEIAAVIQKLIALEKIDLSAISE